MASRYVDIPAIVQVIGCIYQNPSLLDNENYSFTEEDFTEDFHKVIFGSIYNLHQLGAKKIDPIVIENYLEQRPKKLAIYKTNSGEEYLQKLENTTQLAAFDYYYKRMKKMTLLRMYKELAGLNLSWLYDPDNIFDQKKKQQQEDWLDNTPIEKIADEIDSKIERVKAKYVDNADDTFSQAGEGAEELIERLMKYPELGYPLYGDLTNSITRGARLGKLYLRSAATGVGKTRSMIADACTIGCGELYKDGKWVSNGTKEPVVYITTEQQLDEIQTMMLAFIADVDEDHIINNNYYTGELDRVRRAAAVLSDSQIQVKRLPDFSLQDIENTIKFGVREFKARYFFHDYIHSSMKILSEISGKANVKGLREDNILFMIAVRLKDLAVENGIFIMTSTQLNAEYRSAQIYDQNLLRGAKSIADKIDAGMIMLDVSQEDKEALKELVNKNGFNMPDTKISVYKNRRGRYKDILIWCDSNKGTCKITPKFVTNYQYELVDIPALKINVVPIEEESAF